ncbi:MAG: hypothetical protein RMI34_12960, partial [Chloroherpetonaceae bacterium]|nr:hypothetical protein [Chloroherpetonaceae bacterium]
EAAFRRHPIVRYVEYEMGIEAEADGRLRRRAPRALSEVAQSLAKTVGAEAERCAERLREVLVHGAALNRIMAFKLHQFISQGRTLYATLEDRERREFSLEGQLQAGEGKFYFPVKFCRQCGQDYYHVLQVSERFEPHPINAELEQEEQRAGYLTLAPTDGDWWPDQLPEEWYDANGGLRATWRDRVPKPVWVRPDGTLSNEPKEGACKMWWQPEPFSLCLSCGEFYTAREREFAKLASLSSEGRSSATTILATSLLRHAKRTQAAQSKLLTFTDNRQDASFQAGHFNDFVHVMLLRTALYSALRNEKVLTFDRIADAVVKASGLRIADIAKNAQLDPNSLKQRVRRGRSSRS